MKRGLTGHYMPVSSTGEKCRAFMPNPLPPDPPLAFDDELQDLLARANLALGRLDGSTAALPDPAVFLYSYIRKEAVLSSQIEGTQSSLSDLLLFENEAAPGVPTDDVQEVSNYVAAMNHGLTRLKELPVSLRLLKEIHGVLLAKGRGSEKEPGEFRRSQNWIGGNRPGNAAFVPPPAETVLECMGALEKYIHDKTTPTPLLIKAALAHVQFETIHPFLDGNGRIGRLLVALLLCADGALHEPTLYLSLYLKENRQRYYELLQAVRVEGDWEAWLRFFLEGVEQTANQAAATARRLMGLAAADAKRIEAIGKSAGTALRLHQFLMSRPIVGVPMASELLNLSFPAINKSFERLQKLGIVREFTGRQRNRLFAYDACLTILSEGTEPLK
jgi:Fic family protein